MQLLSPFVHGAAPAVEEFVAQHHAVVDGYGALGLVDKLLHLAARRVGGGKEGLPMGGDGGTRCLELPVECSYSLFKQFGCEARGGGHDGRGLKFLKVRFLAMAKLKQVWLCSSGLTKSLGRWGRSFAAAGAVGQEEFAQKVGERSLYPLLAAQVDRECQEQVGGYDDGVAQGLASEPFAERCGQHHGNEPQREAHEQDEDGAEQQHREQLGQLADGVDFEQFGTKLGVAVEFGEQLSDGFDIFVGGEHGGNE